MVHHPHQQQIQQHQPYAYSSYPYPQGAFPGYTAPPPPAASAAASAQTQPAPTTPTAAPAAAAAEPKSADTQSNSSKDVSDAYEAAQSILKAINFGSLLQLPAEETQEGVAARETRPHSQPPANTALIASAGQPSTLLAALGGTQATAVVAPHAQVSANSRADLQAHLALLAAQLVELARVDEGSSKDAAPPPPPPQAQVQQPAQPVPVHSVPYYPPHVAYMYLPHQQHNQPHPQPQPPLPPPAIVDEGVPMAALLPPEPAPPQPPTTQTSVQEAEETPTHQQQESQLQPPPRTEPTPQAPPDAPPDRPEADSGLSGDAPSLQPPNGESQPQRQASPGLSPMEDDTLDAEYESDDDEDMEEVI